LWKGLLTMTYAERPLGSHASEQAANYATTELHDLAESTKARYRLADCQRTRNVLAAALTEIRQDAERERAAWDSFKNLLDSAA
jgi:hypothetical protein